MKNVLITGISKGIGKALAQKFLAEGYFVMGTSTSGEVDYSDENLIIYPLELSSTENIKKCVDSILQSGKKIYILINNAGVIVDKNNFKVDIECLRKTLEVNLIGAINFTEQIISILNNGAHILNASSSAGSLARTQESDDDQYPAYKISKAALNMYTRTLAMHLKDKITVSSFHPGWVKTDMGGPDADMTPGEAAGYIYNLATSKVETGQFWFKGDKMPW
ncbi:MAG: SDR family NAD(P)-dependent oxidoreductase [Minisyncoccia bacterium]